MVTLSEIKHQLSKYLYLIDTDIIDVTLATVVANRIPGDSISLYIIGPSSSAKTEMIELITKCPHVEEISKITPHTLLSGFQEKGKSQEDFSMLTRLQKEDKNILAFKDFTTIISMRREDQGEFMAQLRELADGKITAHYGTGKSIILRGKFGVIAACTNAMDKFVPGTTVLGERFVKYRVKAEMAQQISYAALHRVLSVDTEREEAREMAKVFLAQFALLFEQLPELEPNLTERLTFLGMFGAHLRSPIITDEHNIQVSEVDHEGPARLLLSVRKLAVALAMVRGLRSVDLSLYPLMKKIIKDTMPQYRLKIVEMIYEAHGILGV